jgi:hypothetical protein
MGSKLTASYRLMYFQPEPEDGERVCVALLFNSHRDVELLYDRTFPKLRCLAPRIDPELIGMYLDDMNAHIRHDPSRLDLLVRQYTPQLVASEPRKSVWPLSDMERQYLMGRFLGTHSRLERGTLDTAATVQHGKPDQARANLRALVRGIVKERVSELHEDVKPQWVLGEKVHGMATIAFALRKAPKVVLIDGVDLTATTPKTALKRTGQVTHTFWQYKRFRHERGDDIRLVGVVLNGTQRSSPDYKDAHDFALHQFKIEADLTVDARSVIDLKKLEEELSA